MTMRIATAVLLGAVTAFGLSATLAAQIVPPGAAAPSPGAVTPVMDANLPDGPGRATLLKVCSGCHAPEVVAQQRLTPDGWHDIVEKMAGNGALGSDAEFVEITDYLVKNFSAKPGS